MQYAYQLPESETALFEASAHVDAADLVARSYEPPEFIVRHLIPCDSIVLLSGDTGSAKSSFSLHMAVAIVSETQVASRFPVRPGSRVLYLNGEMGAKNITRAVQEAAAGLGCQIPRNRLFFEGPDAIATFSLRGNKEARFRLQQLVAEKRPDLVIFDTMRELLIEDENNGSEVRNAFSWLRSAIVTPFRTSILVLHHLRKVGHVSNSDRERVSGHRDIIGVVDTHLAARALSGQPMNALSVGKTRTPADGVQSGVTWPIEARLEPGNPSRSMFTAGDPDGAEKNESAERTAGDKILARLSADGNLTIEELGVRSGARKRAWDRLHKDGAVCSVGKRNRKTLYGIAPADGSGRGKQEDN